MWGLLDDMFGASPHTHNSESAQKRKEKCEITAELYDILHEFEALQTMMLPDTYVTLEHPYEWHACIFPQTGFFEGARLNFTIHLGAGYPKVDPTMLSSMPHPLVDPDSQVVNLDAFQGSHRAISLLQFAHDMYVKPEYLLPEDGFVRNKELYSTFCRRPGEMKQWCNERAENSSTERGKLRCGVANESIPLLVEALGHPGSDNHKDAARILTEWCVHEKSIFHDSNAAIYSSNLDSPRLRSLYQSGFAPAAARPILKQPASRPRQVASSGRIGRSRSHASRGNSDEAQEPHRTTSTSFKTYAEEHGNATDELLTTKLWVNAVSLLEEEAAPGDLWGSPRFQDLVDGVVSLGHMRKDSRSPISGRTREKDRAQAQQHKHDVAEEDTLEADEDALLQQWSSRLMDTYQASSAKVPGTQEPSTSLRTKTSDMQGNFTEKTAKVTSSSCSELLKKTKSSATLDLTKAAESKERSSRSFKPSTSPRTKTSGTQNDFTRKEANVAASSSTELPKKTKPSAELDVTKPSESKERSSESYKPSISSRTKTSDTQNDFTRKEANAATSSSTEQSKKTKSSATLDLIKVAESKERSSRSFKPSTSPRTKTSDMQNDFTRKEANAATSSSTEQSKKTKSTATLDVTGASESKECSRKSSKPGTSPRSKRSDMQNDFTRKEARVVTSSSTELPKKTRSSSTLDVSKASESKERSSRSFKPSTSPRTKTSDMQNDFTQKEAHVATASSTELPKKTRSSATLDVTKASKSKNRSRSSSKPSTSPRTKTSDMQNDFTRQEANAATFSSAELPKKTKSTATLDVTEASESKERSRKSSKPSTSPRTKRSDMQNDFTRKEAKVTNTSCTELPKKTKSNATLDVTKAHVAQERSSRSPKPRTPPRT